MNTKVMILKHENERLVRINKMGHGEATYEIRKYDEFGTADGYSTYCFGTDALERVYKFYEEGYRVEKSLGHKTKMKLFSGPEFFTGWIDKENVNDLIDSDFVCFSSNSSEVNAKYFGQSQKVGRYSSKDVDETRYTNFMSALSLGKPMIGIASDGLALAAFSGGDIAQEVKYKNSVIKGSGSSVYSSFIKDINTDKVTRYRPPTSIIENSESITLQRCYNVDFFTVFDKENGTMEGEPEHSVNPVCVYFKKTKSLCFNYLPHLLAAKESANLIKENKLLVNMLVDGVFDVMEASLDAI